LKTKLIDYKNGLKVLFNKQKDVQGLSVWFYFKAGSINDPKGKLGVAHFCEHAFCSFPNDKMTRTERFDKMNQFEYFNAMTGPYDLIFSVRTTDKKLEEAFDFITEPFCSIKLTKKEFEIEQKIIRDEISTIKKLNNSLMYQIFATEIIKNEKTKNLIGSSAGTLETFNKITLKDLQKFAKEYLTLNNLTLVIVGNTSFSKVKKLVKKYIESRIKTSEKCGYELKEAQINKPSLHFRKAVEDGKAYICLTYHLKQLPFIYKKYREEYIAKFISPVLNEMTFNYFRLNQNLCYSSHAYVYNADGWLTFELAIPCGEENLQPIIDKYQEYLKQMPENLPKDLFEKHKEKIVNEYNFDFMNLDKILSKSLYHYEKQRKLYSNKLKKEEKKILESISYEEANSIYTTLFKNKPHLSIISNNEKYKDFDYESFIKTIKN